MSLSFVFLCLMLVVEPTAGFQTPTNPLLRMPNLMMAPKFDKTTGKWSATCPAEASEAGYGPWKSLLLRGPKPFLHRVFQPDNYEQAVLKFMAVEKCDRIEAQGNMDAYLENAQDWAFERFESKRTGVKRNYTEINQKDVVLTLLWAAIVFAYAGRAIYSVVTGDYYWSFLPLHQ